MVTSYTRACDPNGIGLDYAYARATGLSGLQNAKLTRITTQTSNPHVSAKVAFSESYTAQYGA